MHVITYSGKRTPKVAKEITDRSYCLTQGIYCCGLNLQYLGTTTKVLYLILNNCILQKPSENDLHLKVIAPYLENNAYFGDKIYGNVE